MEFAPHDNGIRGNLGQAIEALTKRNELSVVADDEESIWEYYERRNQAQEFTSSTIVDFLKKEKSEKKAPGLAKKPFWARTLSYGAQQGPFGREERQGPSLLPLTLSRVVVAEDYRRQNNVFLSSLLKALFTKKWFRRFAHALNSKPPLIAFVQESGRKTAG
uniref:Photolyase/cryptochrome alpha/beta domain-containing protein n=1 Tax=Haemonchus contortus TaxID=6289 RepID=A0A7I4YT84_HAECO